MASGGFSSQGNTFFQAPFATGARNGLSVDAAGNVVLGNDVGAAGNPAQWLNNREILTNAFLLQLINGLLATDPRTEIAGGLMSVTNDSGNESTVVAPGNVTIGHNTVGGSIILDQGIPLAAELLYIGNLFSIGQQGQAMLQLYLATSNFVISQTLADNGSKLQVDGHISMLSATDNLDFPNTAAQTSSDLTIALAGAAVNDMVTWSTPPVPNANSCYTAFVSAAGVVTMRFNNYSAAAIDPVAADFTVSIFKVF